MNVLYLDHENNRDDITLRLTDMGFRAEQLGRLHYASFPDPDRSTLRRVAASSTS